jgi:hypothetical protein
MSCLDKLGNNPGVSGLQSNLQQIAPTAMQGLTKAHKTVAVGKAIKNVITDIKNGVTTQVNNILNQVTGKVGATINQVKNLGQSFAKLPGAFVKAFKSIGESLAKQAKALRDFIQCEITTTYDSLTSLYETAILQSNINTTVAADVTGVSNNVAKTLTQNPEAKAAYIDKLTTQTAAKTSVAAVATKSNKTIVTEQTKAVDSLTTLAPTIPPGYIVSPSSFTWHGKRLLVKTDPNDTYLSDGKIVQREYYPDLGPNSIYSLKQFTKIDQKNYLIERLKGRTF